MRQRAFRPCGEAFEARSLATAGAAGAVAGWGARAEAIHERLAARRAEVLAIRAEAVAARAERVGAHAEGTMTAFGGGRHRPAPPIGPGLGRGLVRLALPLHYLDYGVITVWNNTFSTVNLTVGASTFANGQAFPFAIRSGQFRSFYAPVIDGVEPVFGVTFDPTVDPILVSKVNVVFEEPAYFPPGKAGRPYSINFGVNGLYLSYI